VCVSVVCACVCVSVRVCVCVCVCVYVRIRVLFFVHDASVVARWLRCVPVQSGPSFQRSCVGRRLRERACVRA
jgi:hypothetical protein